nr:sulfhydryl oxidase 1 [Osmia lignaria]
MERFGVDLLLRLWLIVIITVSCNATVSKKSYDSQIPTQGLYNASDNVVILNATNFKSSVYGDTKGWLVEFYNSWCGFCFRFAPLWKQFANDIYGWRDIVVVAAIDCADDDNNQICREYEIMHYPLIKYFSVNANPSSLGLVMGKYDNVDEFRHSLIDLLEKEQQEGRGTSWPNITPYRNYEITNVWKGVQSTVKYYFLLFEKTDSHLGAEVILDMHKITTLQMRRVLSDNELLCETNKVTNFPSLIAFSRNETQKFLKIRVPTREGVFATIKEFMTSRGENLQLDEQSSTKSHSIENENHNLNTNNSKHLQVTASQNAEITDDYLYQLDLENTLRFSISHEVPLHKVIKEEKMDALKKYFNVLAEYFPLRHSNIYLETIRDIIKNRDNISGEEFSQIIKSTEEEMSPIYSGPPQWIGCKGSMEGYRGYPCGLWTMFHMLTVNYAAVKKNTEHEPRKILEAMHGYIKHFFGCADCSQHFVQMAAKNKMFDVSNDNESILWLWSAHNEVNARLAGDATEDPKHKKIQYPTVEHCLNCKYENGTWNEENVLHYLKNKYSYKEINYHGSVDVRKDNDNKMKIRQERLVLSKYTSTKKIGWDFTIFDISICVVLYITSAVILILVCIKFAVKRTYRKRAYISLLGKV